MVDLANVEYKPTSRVIIVTGNYGSGKTEVAVNLALHLRRSGKTISIADLDVVSPYFRCREARDIMTAQGVRIVMPSGGLQFADLPVLLPEIRGMLNPEDDCISILDLGGDDVGARVLSSLHPIADSGFSPSLFLVVNANRPFTSTVSGCQKIIQSIEEASRLKVSGLVSNSHLMNDTTVQTILSGCFLTAEVSERSQIPIEFIAAMSGFARDPKVGALGVPVLEMERIMLPPWLSSGMEPNSLGAKDVFRH
jgi:hypothetical protein